MDLAELGIDNSLIKNKNLIEKENSYPNTENTSENYSNSEESSLDTEEEGRRKKKGKWLLRMVLKMTPKRATTTLKTTVRKQKVVARKRPPPFTLKSHVNIARTLMCTGRWSRNVLTAFDTITTIVVLYAITRSPRREITSKRAFFGVTLVEQLHTKMWGRRKQILFPF